MSDRELEVYRLIGRGAGTRQIADELHVSVKTVESYQAHIKEKLSLRNARELVHHAIEWTLDEKSVVAGPDWIRTARRTVVSIEGSHPVNNLLVQDH